MGIPSRELAASHEAEAERGEGTEEAAAPVRDRDSRRGVVLDKVALVAGLFAAVVGVVLLFERLAMSGSTWDQTGDFAIARDFLANRSFITNGTDPSQGRLSHLISVPFLALFGTSYFAFKLPFVLVGLAGAAMLGCMLRRAYSTPTAALLVGFYLSNPYVLAASRYGATAGDALVMVLAIACVLTLHRWLEAQSFWPWGALCGLACGAAMAAKWTGGLWVPAAMAATILAARRREGSMFSGRPWTESLAFAMVVTVTAILGSPTFLRGLDFVRNALRHAGSFDGQPWRYFGAYSTAPPQGYFPLLFVSKLTPGFALLTMGALVWFLLRTLRTRSVDRLVAVSLLALLPVLPLARKGFQNAHYYVGIVVTVVVLLSAWIEHARRSGGHLVRMAALLALFVQIGFSLDLAPDHLQAGRHFGPHAQGQFWGPAVNHCQGGPLTLRRLYELSPPESRLSAYVLGDCHEILAQDNVYGPVKYDGRIARYPTGSPPARPHVVLVNGAYALAENSEEAYRKRLDERARALAGCKEEPRGLGSYQIHLCP